MDINIERNKEQNSNKNNLEDYSLKDSIYSKVSVSPTNYNNSNISSKEEISKDIMPFSTIQSISSSNEINPENVRFPYCIVWTPIPCITYIIPSIGHTGIGSSSGVIHDFAGSFFISVDNFSFGIPTKYYQLDLNEQEKYEFDKNSLSDIITTIILILTGETFLL